MPTETNVERPANLDRMMTTPEVAEMLGLSEQTLHDWRCTGRVKLPFVKLGGAVRYRRRDVLEFLDTHTHS